MHRKRSIVNSWIEGRPSKSNGIITAGSLKIVLLTASVNTRTDAFGPISQIDFSCEQGLVSRHSTMSWSLGVGTKNLKVNRGSNHSYYAKQVSFNFKDVNASALRRCSDNHRFRNQDVVANGFILLSSSFRITPCQTAKIRKAIAIPIPKEFTCSMKRLVQYLPTSARGMLSFPVTPSAIQPALQESDLLDSTTDV